jgi:uridine kinase
MNKQIIVRIGGTAGSGKTSIARKVEEVLKSCGFNNITVKDDPHDQLRILTVEEIDRNINVMKNKTDIKIETVQLTRGGFRNPPND